MMNHNINTQKGIIPMYQQTPDVNPVEIHGVTEKLIPSNSMELKKLPPTADSGFSALNIHQSKFAIGARLEGLGYGK
jgi:hypothetical protein